jgi:hypothetical protein
VKISSSPLIHLCSRDRIPVSLPRPCAVDFSDTINVSQPSLSGVLTDPIRVLQAVPPGVSNDFFTMFLIISSLASQTSVSVIEISLPHLQKNSFPVPLMVIVTLRQNTFFICLVIGSASLS